MLFQLLCGGAGILAGMGGSLSYVLEKTLPKDFFCYPDLWKVIKVPKWYIEIGTQE